MSVDISKVVPNAGPVLRLTAMCLLLAVRDKVQRLAFIKRRGEKGVLMLYDEHKSIPPPRHLFGKICKILRQLGRRENKPNNAFEVTYTENKDERRCEVAFNYAEDKRLAEELHILLQELERAEEIELERYWNKRHKRTRQRRLFILGWFLFALTGLTCLSLIFFLITRTQ